MVICQLPTIACNRPLQAHTKDGSRVTGHLPQEHPLVKNGSFGDRFVEGIYLRADHDTEVIQIQPSVVRKLGQWQVHCDWLIRQKGQFRSLWKRRRVAAAGRFWRAAVAGRFFGGGSEGARRRGGDLVDSLVI